MRVRSLQGDTIDALCHRHLGRTVGVVEQVFELNYGISLHGLVLPTGTVVELPDLTTPTNRAEMRPLVQLWK